MGQGISGWVPGQLARGPLPSSYSFFAVCNFPAAPNFFSARTHRDETERSETTRRQKTKKRDDRIKEARCS